VVYSLYAALVSIHVPDDKARAVIDAMEREMKEKLATRADVENLRLATTAEFAAVRSEIGSEFRLVRQEMAAMGSSLEKELRIQIAGLQNNLTIRLGLMMAAMIGAATGLVSLRQYLR
jgi:hypothetical protein